MFQKIRRASQKNASDQSLRAGICAGFAVWTKNEGWLFLLSIIFAHLLVFRIFPSKHVRVFRREFSFTLGLMPILGFLFYFKRYIAPQHVLESSQSFKALLGKMTDISRYFITGKAFLRQIIEPYSLVYSTPVILFGIYAIFLGLNFRQLQKRGTLLSLCSLGIMFCGYFFVFITTPQDLSWHLSTSLSRLFLQLWPNCIFIALMLIASPEER